MPFGDNMANGTLFSLADDIGMVVGHR